MEVGRQQQQLVAGILLVLSVSDGTIPEANIDENLVVDGEMYGCVKSLYVVWNTVDGDGGAHLTTTTRIRDA